MGVIRSNANWFIHKLAKTNLQFFCASFHQLMKNRNFVSFNFAACNLSGSEDSFIDVQHFFKLACSNVFCHNFISEYLYCAFENILIQFYTFNSLHQNAPTDSWFFLLLPEISYSVAAWIISSTLLAFISYFA